MMTPSMRPGMRAAATMRQPGRRPLLAALGGVSLGCAILLSGPAGDRPLTAAEHAQRNAAYQEAEPIVLPVVQSEYLQDRLLLTLWDDAAEDGDIVSVNSDGISISVPLTRQPVRLAISRPMDGMLRVDGVFDGGGGITVALATAYGPLPLPVLTPGQTITVPMR